MPGIAGASDEDAAYAVAEDEPEAEVNDYRYGSADDCSGHETGWQRRAGNSYATPDYGNSFDEGGRAFDEGSTSVSTRCGTLTMLGTSRITERADLRKAVRTEE
jgi:hypothetical protein